MRLGVGVGFLAEAGIAPALLSSVEAEASRTWQWPDRLLIARGHIGEDAFYRALARHLGVDYLARTPRCRAPIEAIEAGVANLAPGERHRLALAPAGEALARMLDDPDTGKAMRRAGAAITTPRLLADGVRLGLGRSLARHGANALPDKAPLMSVRDGLTRPEQAAALVACGSLSAFAVLASDELAATLTVLLGLVFLLSAAIRLAACIEAVLEGGARDAAPRLVDAALPVYTVLVPLHREARVVPQLLAALAGLDYPRDKLDVKLLLEADDTETRQAVEAAELPPWAEAVICPPGHPRTKPRALNIGLLFARGDLVVVYDAEDIPEPDQLRRAVAGFAKGGPRLACLQARLAIDGRRRGTLGYLFALEYAALFDVILPGLAQMGMPIALGGTSNHFRRTILEAVHGWDAWNVTEDADLGLRLARLGYRVGCLDSTTWEEAPVGFDAWLSQRTRWIKGWLQTSLIHVRPLRGTRLSPLDRVGLVSSTFGTVLSAAIGPPLFVAAVWHFLERWHEDAGNMLAASIDLLALLVMVFGTAAFLVPPAIGAMRRGLRFNMRSIGALLLHAVLVWIAGLRAVAELVVDPQRWNKTEHGVLVAATTGPSSPRERLRNSVRARARSRPEAAAG